MRKLKKIKKTIRAWQFNTCPHMETCEKKDKKWKYFYLEDCPKRCYEDDWDYLEEIYCIIGDFKK